MELFYGPEKEVAHRNEIIKYYFIYKSGLRTTKFPRNKLVGNPTEMFILGKPGANDRITLTGIISDEDRNGASAFRRGDTIRLTIRWYTVSSSVHTVHLLDYTLEQDMIEVNSSEKCFVLPVNVCRTLSEIVDVEKVRCMVIGLKLVSIAGGGTVPITPNETALSFTYSYGV